MPTPKLFSNYLKTPKFLEKKQIPSLDGVRAFSIAIVLFGHLNVGIKSQLLTTIFGYGTFGVQFFFVLSGILITTLILKEKLKTNSVDLKSFYIRRTLRILPLAFLFIITTILLNQFFQLGISLRSFLHAATFTENFNSERSYYTSHFWSLSIEEQFYLIFPLLLKKNVKWYLIISFFVIISCPLITILKFHNEINSPFYNATIQILYNLIPRGLISILIGSVSAIIVFKYEFYKIRLSGTIMTIYQASLLIVSWYIFNYNNIPGGIGTILTPILIAVFIFSVMKESPSLIFKILNLKIIAKTGVLSYSIYIWQQFFTNHRPWDNLKTFSHPVINWIIMFIVAYLSYNYFEKPFLMLKKKFEKNSR